jgi:hypothetical protein
MEVTLPTLKLKEGRIVNLAFTINFQGLKCDS